MDDARLLSVAQVAEKLGLTKHQVYRRIARGDLPATLSRQGTLRYVIAEDVVERYIAAGQNALSAPAVDLTMLRVTQVAAMTGFGAETVRRMVHQGIFPSVRGNGPKGHLRIPRRAVEEYLANNV